MSTLRELEVVWGPEGKPTAPDIEIKESDGQTIIVWTAGANVATFEIVGLDSEQFIDQQHNESKTRWATVDINSKRGVYTYNITATRPAGGPGAADPRISNISG